MENRHTVGRFELGEILTPRYDTDVDKRIRI